MDTFDLLAKIYELDHQTYRRRRDYLVDVFEIGEFLKTPVRKLSLGQRMRFYDDTVNSLKRDYLRNKIVDLKLGTAWDDPTLPGVKVLKARDYGVKLEVDCERQSIEFVISRVLARFRVLDMTISDPPMETIIALIYGRKEA